MEEYNELKLQDEPNLANINLLSQNMPIIGEIKADNFEDNLNISDIKNEIKDNKNIEDSNHKMDKCLNYISNKSIENEFSEDLDDINEEFSQRKMSISSLESGEFNDNFTNNFSNINNTNKRKTDLESNKKYIRKITKEELNNIPLPVFSCIYCSNEVIAFKHLLQEIITNKYLFQTSIYDIKSINNLLVYQPIIDKDTQNEKLSIIIIKNTEYIYKNYTKEKINLFFKSNDYYCLCNKELTNNRKYFIQKIEENIVKKKKDFYFKGINKIPKNSLYNKCLFNSTISLINNYNSLSGFVEKIPLNNNINIDKNNNNINNSNISINFNSISLNNNETGNNLCKDNNLLVSIVEHIENNQGGNNEIDDKEEIIDMFGFDMERKISKEKIIWENEYYDIWNPIISDDEDNDDNVLNIKKNDLSNKNNIIDNINQKRFRLKVNLINSKTSNNSFNIQINKKLNVSQIKSLGSTNSSSVINNDNENKIKNNKLSSSKDINSSMNVIHVNTIQTTDYLKKIQNNNSVLINNSLLKSKNLFSELINNINNKNYSNFFNDSSSFKSINQKTKQNKTNRNMQNKNCFKKDRLNSKSYIFNIKKHYIKNNNNIPISNIKAEKFKKKAINKFDENNKNKDKFKIIKNKNIKPSRKLNNYKATKSNIYNNNIYKTIAGNRLLNNYNSTSTSTIINAGASKVISSKIIFNKNKNNNINKKNRNNLNNNSKIFYQINNNSTKNEFSNLLNEKIREKSTIDKIRAKISEITKLINNKNINIKMYNYQINNKMNSNPVNNNQNLKVSKMKANEKGSTCYTKNIYKNLNINNSNINKKIFLPSTFFIRPKSKYVERKNIKVI